MGGLRGIIKKCEKTHLNKCTSYPISERYEFSVIDGTDYGIYVEYCVKKQFEKGKDTIINAELIIRQVFQGKDSHWVKYANGKQVKSSRSGHYGSVDKDVLDYLRKHLPDYVQKQIPEGVKNED